MPFTSGIGGGAGTKGDKGDAATIEIGIVETGEAGTEAKVTNSGTKNAAVLDFVIPKGAGAALPPFVVSEAPPDNPVNGQVWLKPV